MTNPNEMQCIFEGKELTEASGSIVTLDTQIEFAVRKIKQQSANAPTHEIVMQAHGQLIKVGDVFTNLIKKAGPNQGLPYYNLRFHDPSLPEWAENVAAFPTDGLKGNFSIVASRPRRGAQAA